MKKIILLAVAVILAPLSYSQCNDLFISEYQEGFNNNKYIELFNPTTSAIDLSKYRLIRWDNGNTGSDADIRYVQLFTGSIAANSTFTCFLDRRNAASTGADTILWSDLLVLANGIKGNGKGEFYSPDYNASVQGARVLSFNGDDAFSIQKDVAGTWTTVDIFGKIGEQPLNGSGGTSPNGAWTDTSPYASGVGIYLTKDKTVIRKSSVQSGVTTNPALFNTLAEWDTLPVHSYGNLGIHTCSCPTSIQENLDFKALQVFPNPASGNSQIQVRFDRNIARLQVFNLLGQEIYSEGFNSTVANFHTSSFSSGSYLLKVTATDGSSAFRKISLN